MKKILLTILFLCSTSYALSGYSLYKTYVPKDSVTHINLDSNFYRGVNWSNKLPDTIDRNFIRWYDFNSHDSTLRYFRVDTIRSNPHIDSLQGDIAITGSPTITGSVNANGVITGATINTGYGNFEIGQSNRTTDSNTFKRITYTDTNSVNIKPNQLTYPLAANTFITGPRIFMTTHSLGGYGVSIGAYAYHNTSFHGQNNGIYFATTKATGFGGDADNPKTRCVISPEGFLGIGTTSPQYPLHVVGGANAYTTYTIGSSTTNQSFGSKIQAGTSSSDQSFGVYSYGNIPQFTIRGDGLASLWNGVSITKNTDVDSIKIGNYDYLKVYDTGSFPCTLSTAYVTSAQVGVINYTIVGNQVTLRLPTLTGTSVGDWGSQGELKCGSAPSIVTACDTGYVPVIVFGGSTFASREAGIAYIRNGFTSILFYQSDGGNWPTSGNAGWFRKTQFTYSKY